MAALKPRSVAPTPKPAKPRTFKLPRTVAACADRLYACREERAKAQRVVDALEKEEKALKEHLIQMLPKGEASGTMGKVAKAYVYSKPIYQAQDWPKVWAYVKKHDAWELLQKRLSTEAVAERFEAKKKIPGIGVFNVVSVSCTKL